MYVKTHCCMGAAAAVAILNPPAAALLPCLVFSAAGSIIPDIDHKCAAAKVIPGLILLSWCCCYYNLIAINVESSLGIILFIFTLVQFYFSKHRTFSHSLPGLVILSMPIYFINHTYIYAFIIGCGVHLLADSYTKSGVMLYYPFNETSYGLKLIDMHKSRDLPFFAGSLAILILMLYCYW